jgi:peptide-methionine (S)-S-oxide reductase
MMRKTYGILPSLLMFFVLLVLLAGNTCLETPYQKGKEGTSVTGKEWMKIMEKTEFATFGGGCFWCLEAVFERIGGVVSVTSGYAGGHKENPTYDDVCSGNTGHAEVVQIGYNPETITYNDLLDLFWKAHDPTTLNRQGPDMGTQYRSIILYHNEMQKDAALKSKSELERSSRCNNPVVTEIVELKQFYPAEAYHQDYYEKNPYYGYCRVVISPKLKKLGLEDLVK